MSRALLALLLAGCAYDEVSYNLDLADALCELAEDCAPWQVDDACAPPPPIAEHDCTFDEGRALSCVRGVRQLDCPDADRAPPMPHACTEVWDCPP